MVEGSSAREARRKSGTAETDPASAAVGRAVLVLRLVTAISWLFPLLLMAIVAWQTWELEMEELDTRLTSTLAILSEHVEKVLENQALSLDWVADRTRDLTWPQIETSPELFEFMKALADKSPYIDAIFLADEGGIVRASSSRFPLDRRISIADRDYFLAAMNDPRGVHVGEPAKGRLGGNVAFRVAQRRTRRDGSYDGILGVSLTPTYFEKIFADIGTGPGDAICVLRADGALLLDNSKLGAATTGQSESGCTRLQGAARSGRGNAVVTMDGATSMGGTRPLREYALAVGYAINLDGVRHEWLQDMALYGSAAVASSFVLFGLSFAALRIARNERRAVDAWRDEVEQRRRIEAEMRQASKMEALGRMAGGIAHHFNNLLPAVSGLLKLTLTEVAPGGVTAKRLERMIDAVAQGQRLVRNILLFSRRQVMTHERVAVAPLIEKALALVEGLVPTNVRVLAKLQSQGEVVADSSQLHEVVMNLVSNAVHAIGANPGIIELQTSDVTLDSDTASRLGVEPGGFVHVVCRDNGGGMTTEVAERAFDPFFTTKPGAEGTGLGLAIVHGVVTGVGGAVRIESTPGVGTTFHLYLPIALAPERRNIAA